MNPSPQRGHLFTYLQEHYNSEPEYLWENTPQAAVFRHPASRKWFALFLEIPADRLGLAGEELVQILNVKCDPILIGALREEPGFFPAYHMNKSTWVTILLDAQVTNEQVIPLLEESYDSVTPKRNKRHSEPHGSGVDKCGEKEYSI